MSLPGFSTKFDRGWRVSVPVAEYDYESSTTQFSGTIPPERIGLSGEYDHNGLAKRVYRDLSEYLPPEVLRRLSIRQRGGVIVLTGRLPDQHILGQVIKTALNTMGAFAVESYGVKLTQA